MLKKLAVSLVIFIVAAAAYIAGSYYVGYRAEQQLVAIMNDAQNRANNQLAWEQVEIKHGVFASTGTMTLVLKEVKVEDKPARTRIDYIIHHHLNWSHLAHFVWSLTPDGDLARKFEPLYPQTPSLTGEGALDWAGVARSSIAFPGIGNANINDGTLTVAPLTGSLTAGANRFDIKVGVANVTLTGTRSPERMQLNGLTYEARSDDVQSGSVAATLSVADALLIGEDGVADTVSGYRWHFDVVYQNDILNIDTQKTIASITALGNQVSNIDVSVGIDGLHRSDLQAVADLVDEVNAGDGQWLALSDSQQAQAAQIGLSMLARGLTLRVPSIQADIKLMGDDAAQTVGLEDFRFSAQATDPEQGVGRVSLSLGALKVPALLQILAPQITDFEFEVENSLVDGRTQLRVSKSLASLEQGGQSVRDVQFEARLKGLAPEGLLVFLNLMREVDGELADLSDAQLALMTQILQEAAGQGLVFEVPVAKATVDAGASGPDSLALEGLDVQIKLDDVATGAGKASVLLKNLSASGPQMTGVPKISNYQLAATNQVIDGVVDYQLEQSVDALDSNMVKLGSSALSMRLTGLSSVDLQRLSELAPEFEAGLDQAQTEELAQIIRRAIASGFALSIPKLQLAIDDATVDGQAEVSLAGLGQAPLVAFNIARLAQMQAQVSVNGQSPLLDPWVQQGLMMGLFTGDGNAVEGQYQFKDGRLQMNGLIVPTGDFALMANLMVQQMLAQHLGQGEGTKANEPGAATRQRRGPGN